MSGGDDPLSARDALASLVGMADTHSTMIMAAYSKKQLVGLLMESLTDASKEAVEHTLRHRLQELRRDREGAVRQESGVLSAPARPDKRTAGKPQAEVQPPSKRSRLDGVPGAPATLEHSLIPKDLVKVESFAHGGFRGLQQCPTLSSSASIPYTYRTLLESRQDPKSSNATCIPSVKSALDWLLIVPTKAPHGVTLRAFNSLPPGTVSSLTTQFDNDFGAYSDGKGTSQKHAVFMSSDKWVEHEKSGICLRTWCDGRSPAPMHFNEARGNKSMACDRCCRTGSLCARIVKDAGVYKMCFFPRAESVRAGIHWSAEKFWVI